MSCGMSEAHAAGAPGSVLRNTDARKTMAEQVFTLLHVLAAELPQNGRIRTRSTVRTGTPKVGERYWFEDAERNRGMLTVVSLKPSPRWWTIDFSGLPQDLVRIRTGTYVRGETS